MDLTPRERLDALISERHAFGLSQTVLAKQMGTSQPSLARLEDPKSDPRLSSVERYARALKALAGGAETHSRVGYTIEEIEEYMAAAYDNSSGLVSDARLLFDAGRFPRGYALGELALEEAGKCLQLLKAGTETALGNTVDWNDLRRRLAEHGSKIRVVALFDWAVHDQHEAWVAGDLATLLADGPGRRKATAEAAEALFLRERALYAQIGPSGLSTPEVAVGMDNAEMIVSSAEALLQKMREIGIPPPKGTLRRIARMPDQRRRAQEMRKALNRLPGVIPF